MINSAMRSWWWLACAGLLLAVLSGGVRACGSLLSPSGDGELVLPRSGLGRLYESSYFVELLQQVLARTEAEYGPCKIVFAEQRTTRMRSAAMISNRQELDLFWATTSIEREMLLRPVRVPLLKGLMSYKLLLIRVDDQPNYSRVKVLADLLPLRAGQGADWPDTKILRSNGISVITSSHYDALPQMLSAGRFDFFPRGAHEILGELANTTDDLDLAIEQELVLIYPAPVYFFVSVENLPLAQRLEQGLAQMLRDGSFDAFFYNHPMIQAVLSELHLTQRRAIYLHNPLLPPATPLAQDELWLFPWSKLHH